MISQDRIIELFCKRTAGELLSPQEESDWNVLKEKYRHLFPAGIDEEAILETVPLSNKKETLWEKVRKSCLEAGMIETRVPAVHPIATVTGQYRKLWFRPIAAIAAVLLGVVIIYQLLSPNKQEQPTLTSEVITPRGSVRYITLPDSSKIQLNADSRLRFPPAFSGNERIVELSGEAFFEVAKNAAKPFIVNLDKGLSIRVTGTSFNVNAYNNEDTFKISLFEGSIRLMGENDSVQLIPNQQAQVSLKQQPKIKVTEMKKNTLGEATQWINNNFYFDGISFPSAMRQLERWYNVHIMYPDQLAGRTIQLGPKPRTVSISQILNIIKDMRKDNFEYKIEGRNVILTN